MTESAHLGSARVSRAGRCVSRRRTSAPIKRKGTRLLLWLAGRSPRRRDAFASTRDARATRILAALALVSLVCSATARAADPDTFSPVVSYQYHDSLSDPSAQTPILSPVVSYQYFDWPGDENLIFTNSPNVSYRYDGPPTIIMQPTGVLAKAGNTVTLSVTADGTPPLTYQWRLNGVALTNTNSASIQIANAQPANSGSYSVVISNGYLPAAVSTDAKVTVFLPAVGPTPTPPPLQPTNQALLPSLTAAPSASSGALLMFDSSGQINPSASPDPNKMTIIMTHGWLSDSDAWPTTMAAALIVQRFGSVANIAAWDWRRDANPNDATWNSPTKVKAASLSQAVSRTRTEGVALGNRIVSRLGLSYNRPIHFYGHSLGALVNSVAADYLHGDLPESPVRYSPYNTQLTLFDEAELAQAVHGVYVAIGALLTGPDYDPTGYWSWRVIPRRSKWIDNYVSLVGFFHPQAANASLWREVFLDPPTAHGYGYQWYTQTITNPGATNMGHRWSVERNSIAGSQPEAGSYYDQSKSSASSDLLLTRLSPLHEAKLNLRTTWAYPHLIAYDGLYGLNVAAQGAISGVLQYARNAAVGVVQSFTPISEPTVYIGTANSTPAYIGTPLSPQALQATFDFQYNLGGTSSQRTAHGESSLGQAETENGPAHIVIPITVPKTAEGLTFDYQFQNPALGDFMRVAIGEETYFTLESAYTDTGSWATSPVIDVAAYAGQEIQLIFIVNNAAASPTGMLQIQGIQFHSPPAPKLTLAVQSGQASLSWPMIAVDWTLEANDDLANQGSWVPVTATPTDTDYFHSLTLDITGENKFFFRLRK